MIFEQNSKTSLHYSLINEADEKMKRTPLFLAVKLECIEMVKTLLENGASLEPCDVNEDCILHVAARCSNPEIIRVCYLFIFSFKMFESFLFSSWIIVLGWIIFQKFVINFIKFLCVLIPLCNWTKQFNVWKISKIFIINNTLNFIKFDLKQILGNKDKSKINLVNKKGLTPMHEVI